MPDKAGSQRGQQMTEKVTRGMLRVHAVVEMEPGTFVGHYNGGYKCYVSPLLNRDWTTELYCANLSHWPVTNKNHTV